MDRRIEQVRAAARAKIAKDKEASKAKPEPAVLTNALKRTVDGRTKSLQDAIAGEDRRGVWPEKVA